MRPKVGLILGGGAARGYAHLGILKKLRDENIPVDFIIGTSMGALIGALYASNNDIDSLLYDAINEISLLNLIKLIDLGIPLRGFVKGDKIEKFLSNYIKSDFKDLSIPLYIVATDVKSGKEVIFSGGSLLKAVRASISIPVVFEPVDMQGIKLVDGSVVNFDAKELAWKLGADIIIISDVKAGMDNNYVFTLFYRGINCIKNMINTVNNTTKYMYLQRHVNFKKALPEVFVIMGMVLRLLCNNANVASETYKDAKVYIIKPQVKNIKWFRFDCAEKCINKGLEAAETVILQIKEQLKSAGTK
jgi:NTE family protein